MKKYSKFLTFLLVILTVSLIILVAYTIYNILDNYLADQSAEDLMAEFEDNYEFDFDNEDPSEETNTDIQEPVEGNNTNSNSSTTPSKKPSGGGTSYKVGTYYKGYKVIGVISIPKLNIQYPIFSADNNTTLKVGTAAIYPSNVEEVLNTTGNVVIAGHNYRNTRMFSKLHTLKDGDSIYITNMNGVRLEYKVYNNYTTGANEFNYATRDTNGNIEISLTTCTNDASTRTIVWARVQ